MAAADAAASRRRRSVVAAAGASLVVWVVGADASVDPRALVLHPADAPAQFTVDRKLTHYVTNDAAIRLEPRIRARIHSTGRITGYATSYEHRVGTRVFTVNSVAHLMTRPAGAAIWLAADDEQEQAWNQQRKRAKAHVYRRQALTLGDEGWMYWIVDPRNMVVEWRIGRTVGILMTWGLSRDQTIELARKQVKSMRAALG